MSLSLDGSGKEAVNDQNIDFKDRKWVRCWMWNWHILW